MKKWIAILLSLLLLAGAGAYGYYSLRLSPNGAMNPGRPAVKMEELLQNTSAEQWKSLLSEAWSGEVTEYESREEIFSRIYERSAADSFSFRSSGEENSFVLSSGSSDLAVLRFGYENDAWTLSETRVLLGAETHSIRIEVPENIVPTVNGKTLPESAVTDFALPYADMSELELQFETHSVRRVYELSGLYETPTVEAEGARCILIDGNLWSYEPTDARSYGVKVLAPATATVLLNGVTLSESEVVGTEGVSVDVEIPEELTQKLPSYKIYQVSGLYSADTAVSVETGDGRKLEQSEENGVLCFRETSATAPEPEIETVAGEYLKALCNYGAGKVGSGGPCQYVVPDAALQSFIQRAAGSLVWIQGTGLELQEPHSGEYISLDADTCVCTSRVVGTVSNSYSTYEAEFACQLLLVRTENGWKVTDMAYE